MKHEFQNCGVHQITITILSHSCTMVPNQYSTFLQEELIMHIQINLKLNYFFSDTSLALDKLILLTLTDHERVIHRDLQTKHLLNIANVVYT